MNTQNVKNGLKILIPVALLLISACKDASVDPPPASGGNPPGTTGEKTFSGDVKPLLSSHGCTGCHGGSGGLTLGTVAGLLAGGNHGPAVIPGNADSSNIVKKISAGPPFGSRMPLGGPYLSSTEIQVIKDWINAGAKDN
jgi:hypothetical protein